MKDTRTQSITALFLVATMLTACATPQGSGAMAQSNPCQPNSAQSSFSPQTSFIQQALLNPLAKMGGTLLATAAANYSKKYTGKLDALLNKLVTPKSSRKKNSDQQTGNQGFSTDNSVGQSDMGFVPPVDPNTGMPIDPNFGNQGQFPQDPGLGTAPYYENLPPQGTDPNYQGGYYTDPYQEGVQPRGVPGQLPHATFSSNPCDQQQTVQNYPTTGQPTQPPYGYDPNYPTQPQDPYAQQQGQNSYGQPYPSDPYTQQGYPQDPYGQPPTQQDPYAQSTYPSDPYAQPGYPNDPYAQTGYPQDPYGQPAGQQAPYAQTGLPQDSNLLTGYPTTGGLPGTPIGLDVVMVKKTMRNGAPVMVPIQDGDVLRDGQGNAQAGDKFRIMFRPHTDGYVYVIAIDGSGWAQGIFPPPTSPLANPVKAGEQYVLPEGNNWFSLDQYKGIETIFFVASQEKRKDIEEILQSITGRERPATENPHQVTKVAMVPYGVGGARPGTQGFNLAFGTGQDQTVMPTSYFAKTASQDLRLTRWFRHE